ncbi:MAG: DUF1572 family protein [Planctomycetales bacterium]|nr:DUF1572 family protein [Planctomycetales bacterium]
MTKTCVDHWLDSSLKTVDSYRRMIDGILSQLTDTELNCRPAEGANSVAIILRHLGGNLRSRWTDFLMSDGEKPDREREKEFAEWEGSRESLLEYFDSGWVKLLSAIEIMRGESQERMITIRGESHTLADALLRSITHISYHVGQMILIARVVHQGEWNWLTIAPGRSAEFNSQNWGSSASRGVFGPQENRAK